MRTLDGFSRKGRFEGGEADGPSGRGARRGVASLEDVDEDQGGAVGRRSQFEVQFVAAQV